MARLTMVPSGFWDLYHSSYRLREEVKSESGYQTFTPYVPTDLDHEVSEKEFWDGWNPDNGVCPTCFQLRAASGKCECV